MNAKDFEQICSDINIERHKIVGLKRREYTEGSDDVLWNFKQTARELNIDPMIVAYIFFRKHVASIGQVCADRNRGDQSEAFLGRISDAMNYLELIFGLYHDNS